MESPVSASERYERGQTLKQAKMYYGALDEFRHASADPQCAGKAHAQLGLCFRALGRYGQAAAAFREALTNDTLSAEEKVHLLYVLGMTLESLGDYAAALETYNQVRKMDAGFRDVTARIKHLCAGGRGPMRQSLLVRQFRAGDLLRLPALFLQRWQSLGRSSVKKPHVRERPGRSAGQEVTRSQASSPLVTPNRPVTMRGGSILKRQHTRVAMQCRSQFAAMGQTIAGEGQLRNLSPGGCRVTSSIFVPVGAELTFWIFPQNELEPFTIEGATVQWRHAKDFGLAFTNVQPGIQRQIAQLCAQPV
jgi:tetratricopeptide (TPR) repeat protein